MPAKNIPLTTGKAMLGHHESFLSERKMKNHSGKNMTRYHVKVEGS